MRENPDALCVVTGHVIAPNAPWLTWLDAELRAGRTVNAWADVASNCPAYVEDLADVILKTCSCWGNMKGLLRVTSEKLINRVELFRDYAEAFGLDEGLIESVAR